MQVPEYLSYKKEKTLDYSILFHYKYIFRSDKNDQLKLQLTFIQLSSKLIDFATKLSSL